ncbi:hypothetical protein BI344_18090 [Chromobacterium sphagni]|uniref:Uncharacterized protein n=1 Tax=Chromobacterium sphagni TaxID=1903179 RepID=A0ABX3CBI3_9NEIS|nr:hypothetical protein BI344_18090 [Chromobacterium sphagni]
MCACRWPYYQTYLMVALITRIIRYHVTHIMDDFHYFKVFVAIFPLLNIKEGKKLDQLAFEWNRMEPYLPISSITLNCCLYMRLQNLFAT